jgi:hypothetical protein
VSSTLSTGMTVISLHMQWPLASQLHGGILKENNETCCFLSKCDVTYICIFHSKFNFLRIVYKSSNTKCNRLKMLLNYFHKSLPLQNKLHN